MLPSTPSEFNPPPEEKRDFTEHYKYTLHRKIIQDYEFWEALRDLSQQEVEDPKLSPLWRRAYESVALACDVMAMLIYRYSQREDMGPY